MIYGIGAPALGGQLAVSENDASVFMESFKAKFTGNAFSGCTLILQFADSKGGSVL